VLDIETCLHLALDEKTHLHPDSLALISDDATLTFTELDREANRLAEVLRGRGVGSGDVVGLLGGPSVESVIGLLAILKSDAAYVPLEPLQPISRQAAILEQAQPKVLLCEPGDGRDRLANRWPTVDTTARELAHDVSCRPVSSARPNDLCYVMFTSGTTGRPRGVLTSHRASMARVTSLWSDLPAAKDERAVLKASLSVVDSVREIFGSLLAGAPVVVLPAAARRDPALLVAALHRHHVTRVLLVPKLLRSILELHADEPSRLASVRRWIVSGDAADVGLLALVREVTPWAAVSNLYGLTEAPGTLADLTDLPADKPVVVGRPLPGVRLYVLEEDGQPALTGHVGEVCLGGPGLADGYLAAPVETLSWFVGVGAQRLFRTGDLGRLHPDGDLELLGRADDQLKIRGHRIEPTEVEHRLRALPAVADVAVGLDPERDKLTAYLVPGSGELNASTLHQHLLDELPAYHVPTRYLRLTALSYEPSGKLNRARLRVCPAEELPLAKTYAAPRTDTEQAVAKVWGDVLDVDSVGRDDHFFDLGGDSLSAAQVLARIRRRIRRDVPMRILFDNPVLRNFAAEVAVAKPLSVGPVARADLPDFAPASLAQRRIWFFEQLLPGTAAYNMASAFQLEGPIDTTAFEASLRHVVNRQEALRTTFELRAGEPHRRFMPESSEVLTFRDLVGLAPDEAERAWTEEFERHALVPFDLQQGPLFRFQLFTLADNQHVFALVVHHAVFDGWSERILLAELADSYERIIVTGSSSSTNEPECQYRHYSTWQHEQLETKRGRAQIEFWRRHLAAAETVIDLPVDRPWPTTPTFSGRACNISLGSELSNRLLRLAARQGVTPFMLLLSVFHVALAKFSGQNDLVIGTPTAGRRTPKLERIIGFFVNTLPLRIDGTDDLTFVDLVGRVKNICLDARDHEDVPFDCLVEVLRPERDLSRNPLFQVWFDLAKQFQPLMLRDVQVRQCRQGAGSSRFDLEMQLIHGERSIYGSLIYNTDIFNEDTAQRLVALFQAVAKRVVDDAKLRLSQIDVVTGAERRLLIEQWSGLPTYLTERSMMEPLVAQFERTAEDKADKIALVFHDQQVTYRGLNEDANRLARHLRDRGATRGQVIAICVPRGLEFVTAILSVLKAGCAYLPLDPDYPRERLGYMLANASASLVVTHRSTVNYLPATDTTCVLIDAEATDIAARPAGNLGIDTDMPDLVYVLFTSGSTGRPKGIAMPQGPLANLIAWQRATSSFADRTVQFASFNFDVSFQDTFSTLLSGGSLVILDEDQRHEPELVLDAISSFWASRVFLPPMVLREIAKAWEATRPPLRALREVVCAGERLQVDAVVKTFLRETGVARLVNHYGPTETHVATWHELAVAGDDLPTDVPIGQPIDRALVYVLDSERGLLPVGVPGELYIGGDVVSNGYVGRPDLTRERFVRNPFLPEPARMYRTGDRVRWLSNGVLQYLGRLDDQVKIRGFRVETGEVESLLLTHPAVNEAAVVARESDGRGRYLVAYLVARANVDLTPSHLRTFVANRLPAYMVPAAYVVLDQFPLNHNGKLDRRNLPASGSECFTDATTETAPRTPTERKVAAAWADALGLERVGVEANFFDLGGHSLLAIRAISTLRQRLGLALPLRLMFERPTVVAMAATIDTELAKQTTVTENGGAD
jgi:amino acid adenylation domain-containing protein